LKAVIMAGGEGARLRPLTCDRPKPMVPLMDRPMMEYIVELLARHNLRDVAVTLQYQPQKIKEHFGSGEGFGVRMTYYLEDEPLGTAGSVKNAASFLDDTFVVISGDCLTDIDLEEALQYHRQKKALATIVLTPQENPLDYGIVILEKGGRVSRFLEKPRWGEVFSDTVNTGIYILEPAVLDYIPSRVQFDFSKDLFPLLLEMRLPLYGCVLPGFWCDIGSDFQYMQAQRSILEGNVKVKILVPEVKKGHWMAPDAHVDPDAHLLPPLFIGAGSRICSGAQVGDFSVIGRGSIIGKRAHLKRGITWDGVVLGEASSLKGGILCRKVSLGPGAAVYEGAVVGDRGVIEEQSVVKPNVKIWPHKLVESGTTVSENLVWSGCSSKSLFGFDGVKGELNRDLSAEMIMKLGAAFGSIQGRGARVVTASDGDSSSQMLKKALQVGLLTSGLHVLDLGDITVPVARLGASWYGAAGGAYVQNISDGNGSHCLRFFDKDGMNLSRGEERKAEQLYWRDDFARVSSDHVKSVQSEGQVVERYRDYLLSDLDAEVIRKMDFRVVLGCPSSFPMRFFPGLLKELGCRVHFLEVPAIVTPETLSEDYLQQSLKDAVTDYGAHLGAVFCSCGEKMLLASGEGSLAAGEMLEAIFTLLQLRHRRLGSVAVPVTASRVHEELAGRYRGRVIRTKTSPRFLMEACKHNGIHMLPLSFDGLKALLELLDFLAAQKKSLCEVLAEIPSFYMEKKEISCSWGQKGRIMRRLVEETPREQIEMIDGLKVSYPEGWALILPDPERPAYRIYSEGNTEEIAESLTDFYLDRVDELKEERGR